MSTPNWIVESFHINISAGDAAIHLLVDQKRFPVKESTVYGAVWIDGGKKGNGIPGIEKMKFDIESPSRRMMKWINDNYKFKQRGDKNELTFDSIIVTHWDNDHYGGVVEALSDDAGTYGDVLPYIQYDISGAPSTVFYAPNLDGNRDGKGGKKLNTPIGKFYIDTDEETIAVLSSKFKWVTFAQWRAADDDVFDVLGVNFFNNQALPAPKRGIDMTATGLLDANPPGTAIPSTGSPAGMYCVAVYQKTFPYPHSSPIEIVPSNTVTLTNRVSVACLVMWKNGTGVPRCSHYFAGDLEDNFEQEVVKWMLASGITSLTSCKLSHHGSHSSTPINMIQNYQPLNVLTSNPKSSYIHPAWELVLVIGIWARMATNPTKVSRCSRMFGIKYPFWLVVDDKGKYVNVAPSKPSLSLNTHAFYSDDSDFVKFLEEKHKSFIKAGTAPPETEYDLYKKAKAVSVNDGIKALLDMSRARWEQYCFPTAQGYPAASSSYFLPALTKGNSERLVECVRIVSYDDSILDGSVSFKTFQDPIFRAWVIPWTKPAPSATKSTKRTNTDGITSGGKDRALTIAKKRKTSLRKGSSLTDDSDTDHGLVQSATLASETDYVTLGTDPDEMDSSPGDPGVPLSQVSQDGLTSSGDSAQPQFAARPNVLLNPASDQGAVPATTEETSGVGPAWYISSSSIADHVKVYTQDYNSTSIDSQWDGFLATLHCGLISLSSNPNSYRGIPNASIALADEDDWACWMQDCLQASDLSLLTGGEPDDAGISGFSFAIKLGPLNPTSPSAFPDAEIPQIAFSTSREVLATTFNLLDNPPPALRDGATALMFGLDWTLTKHGDSITLGQLAQFVGLESLLDEAFINLVFGPFALNLPDSAAMASGRRNAIWFEPQSLYRLTVRLEFVLSPSAQKSLNEYLSILGDIEIQNAALISRRSSIWNAGPDTVAIDSQGKLVIIAKIQVSSANLMFDAIIELEPGLITIEFILQSKTSAVIDEVISWLKSALGLSTSDFPFTDWLKQTAGSTSFEFDFRRITFKLIPDPQSGSPSFASFALDMEVSVLCNAKTNQKLLFLATYQYISSDSGQGSGSSLQADLWIPPLVGPNDPSLLVLPQYENYAYFEPLSFPNFQSAPKYVDLAAIGGFESAPEEVPTDLIQAGLFVSSAGIAFKGTLKANAGKSSNNVPLLTLDQIDLAVSYVSGKSGTSGFAGSLAVTVLIPQPTTSMYGAPAQLIGSIDYQDGNWTFSAALENLYASTLFIFFDQSIQDAIAPVIECIVIKSLTSKYTYDSSGQTSELTIGADILIGALELKLDYENKGKDSWSFYAEADLQNNKSNPTTLGAVLTSLVGSTDGLPDFITDVKIQLSGTTDFVKLFMTPLKDEAGNAGVFFTLEVSIAFEGGTSFKFRYIQFCTAAAARNKEPLKRVFIASVESLPEFDVPLIGNITQPFDEALLMWVQPQEGFDGLTKGDLDLINLYLTNPPFSDKELPYKKNKKDPTPSDVVLNSGIHGIIVLKDTKGNRQVVVDYIFGKQTTEDSELDLALVVNVEPTDSSQGGGSGMTAYPKSYGPLAVRNLGLKYADSMLSIKIDAMVTIGPIAFELIGASIGLTFAPGHGFTITNLPTPSFSIDGLGAAFDRAPLLIAGILLIINQDGLSGYSGALQLSYQPWMFAAAGFYGHKDYSKIKTTTVTRKAGNTADYTTAFVYAVLNGPLITLEFATITGVTAGFGYNTNLKLPAAKDIPDFPLVKSPSPPSSGASSALDGLIGSGWFFPQDGSFWIAAGLSVTAFEILQVTAVIVVEWDPSLKLGLYGLATAAIPSIIGSNGRSFALVQLGLAATIDFGAGTMKIDGQLTPASYILDPSCHLTGGFALYSWFGDADQSMKGDWVFTIGGYHQAFIVPAQYPTPPRLAISWQFSSSISISGQAYFAITPKVCMGGGRLDITLSLGPLSAFLDAYVDFLINFKPFHFIADGGIDVGVRYTMDLWLVTLHISVEIGAHLYIAGPPIHGNVHVNFWVFGFDIDFGSSPAATKKLTLPEFIAMVCQAPDPSTTLLETITEQTFFRGKVTEEDTPRDSAGNDAHVFSVEDGLISSGSSTSSPSSSEDIWIVRASSFTFMLSCKFAADSIAVVTGNNNKQPEHVDKLPGTGNSIHAKPMQENTVTSTVTVRIVPNLTVQNTEAEPLPTDPIWNHNERIDKNLPNGLWGLYDRKNDPSSTDDPNALKGLLDGTSGGSVSLLCGVHIAHPDPLQSQDTMPAYPFEKFMVSTVEKPDKTKFLFPKFSLEPGEYLPVQPNPIPGNQWDDVKNAWAKSDTSAKSVTGLWKDVALELLGWDPAKMDSAQGQSDLTGQVPENLLDDFYDYYLYAPLLNAVA